MTKLWVAILAGAGGFALGILITKQIAENRVTGGVHDALDKVGLGGGVIEKTVDSVLLS